MKYLVTFYSKGAVLGQSEVECPMQPVSTAYFCTTCGDIWGRVFVKPVEHEQSWEAVSAPCVKHRPRGVADWSHVPGSFLVGTEMNKEKSRITAWARVIEHMPESVLKYELEVHEINHDRKLKDEQDQID